MIIFTFMLVNVELAEGEKKEFLLSVVERETPYVIPI